MVRTDAPTMCVEDLEAASCEEKEARSRRKDWKGGDETRGGEKAKQSVRFLSEKRIFVYILTPYSHPSSHRRSSKVR